MNTLPSKPEKPDDLDRLLSEFFKSELKKPWPKAPGTGAPKSEPSELAAARTAEAPRNQPSPSARDNTARARFTLAASVALLLGTCWYLSNGFQPTASPGPAPSLPSTPKMLPVGGADGKNDPRLLKISEDNAKEPPVAPPKIDMGKIGDLK